MNYNILLGGSAGQGLETLASILEKTLKRKGFEVFTIRDYMSRVRGGHNFVQVRFGNEKLVSHWDTLLGIIALNEETIKLHIGRVEENGFIIADEDITLEDSRILRLPLKETAKKAGNIKYVSSIAFGAFLKLIGVDLTFVEEVLQWYFTSEIAEKNFTSARAGYQMIPSKFSILSQKNDDNILINGNEAIALGALAAGCRFYSAYPMTPSTSIMNYLATKMEEAEIVVEQAEDEISAINMAIGASYAGVRAMTGTSGGGFSLKVEALGLSGMMEIPLVIAEIQRPGPTTGLPTRTEQSDLKFVINASQGEFPRMVIAPRHPEDAFFQTVRAFTLADKYQIPVILLGDQYLADSTATVKPFDFSHIKNDMYLQLEEYIGDREYKRYKFTASGISPRIIPGKIPGHTVLVDSDEHDEWGHITESAQVRKDMMDKRLRKLKYLEEELEEPEFIGHDVCEILLLAWGSLYGPVREAVENLNREGGKRYGALVFGDLWPLPQKRLQEKVKNASEIINIEQNATGQLASVIAEIASVRCSKSILKYDGRPISSQQICERLKLLLSYTPPADVESKSSGSTNGRSVEI